MLLGNSLTPDTDDLDTTLPNVILDQEDLALLDVGFSDDESDGNPTDFVNYWDFSSLFIFTVYNIRVAL